MSDRVVALVTGSSSGIGSAVAVDYSKLNYHVVITGRDEDRLREVAEECKQASPDKLEPLIVQADFADLKQVDDVFNKTIEKFQRLDILVNNAGFMGRAAITDDNFMEDYEKIMAVNLTSAVRLCQLAMPYLKKSTGSVVNVGSVLSKMAYPTVSYSVSKAGLIMLTKTLANACDKTGVRVNSVLPGPILTRFGPNQAKFGCLTLQDRAGTSQEVSDLIIFLTSNKASYINGAEVTIDGGYYAKCPGIDVLSKVTL